MAAVTTIQQTTSDFSSDAPSTLFKAALAMRQNLMNHPVYSRVCDVESTRVFMEHHVWAVWDFMSLLKGLQQRITCTHVPWTPPRESEDARLINEIVVGEETDEDGKGNHISHFELYLQAMEGVGADTSRIRAFVSEIRRGVSVENALERNAPMAVRPFVRNTISTAMNGKTHEIAASFFYGREDVIPDMFRHIVKALSAVDSKKAERLVYYLERHIEVDGDSHGPAAKKLLQNLCGIDQASWREASTAAIGALRARMGLWEGVCVAIDCANAGERPSQRYIRLV